MTGLHPKYLGWVTLEWGHICNKSRTLRNSSNGPHKAVLLLQSLEKTLRFWSRKVANKINKKAEKNAVRTKKVSFLKWIFSWFFEAQNPLTWITKDYKIGCHISHNPRSHVDVNLACLDIMHKWGRRGPPKYK
jgi:hypothetical protein